MKESSSPAYLNIRLESLLYFLAFILALVLRLVGAGLTPLDDSEAVHALQALALANGNPVQIGHQPGYVLLTSVVFFMFSATNAAARLLPAIAGSLLVWAPYLLRERLDRRAALVLAFGLALEPGLVAASRMPGSAILALPFGVLAVVFFYRHRMVAAGIFAALALMGGSGLWLGILILLLVGLWMRLFSRSTEPADEIEGVSPAVASTRKTDIRAALPWFVVTLAGVGTLLFLAPGGLSGIASSLVDFVRGWVSPNGITIWRVLAAFILYTPLALIFGVSGTITAWRSQNALDRFLSRWFLIALLVVLAYPAHQVTDLIWALVPLWGLAARQIVRIASVDHEETLPLIGLTAIQIVLFIFAWLNLVIFSDTFQAGPEYQLRWISVVGAVLLAIVVAFLAGWGWSKSLAVKAMSFSLLAVLGLYGLGSAFQSAGVGANPNAELWHNSTHPGQVDLMLQTVRDLSEWNSRSHDGLELYVLDADSPALRWALHDYGNATFVQTLPASTQPAMVLTTLQELPGFAASYTGQDFNWQAQPNWQGVAANNFLRWIINRETPMTSSQLILWVRTDLMPGDITENDTALE